MQIPVAAMAKTAGVICKNADVSSPSGRPSADDLLVLLAVGRSGRYNTAADELGLNHTTISRRIAALEQSIGGRVLVRVGGGWELTDLGREALSAAEAVESAVRSLTVDPGGMRTLEGVVRISATDGFSAYIAAPAAADVQRRHPKVAVEIVAATRRATQQRSDSTSRSWSANQRSIAPRRSGLATTALASTVPATTSPIMERRRVSRTSPAIRWSTSSTRCCRSMSSTERRASPPRCANQSRPPMFSYTSRRPGRPQASACCRASWPTATTTWSACCPTLCDPVDLLVWSPAPKLCAGPRSPPSWTRFANGYTNSATSYSGCVSDDVAAAFAPCVVVGGATNAMTTTAHAHVAASGACRPPRVLGASKSLE
ncbi:MAG: hypothetical protein QOK45_2532 [Mycobacterium sp.]|nr:hypothetical protein [Mycobacterium sp.]